MAPTRRQLLQTLAASAAVAGLPRPARAEAAGARRRFLFVTCFGGWDPTRTLTPAFDNPLVSVEAEAAPLTVGDLSIVDHPRRPEVRTFFERYGDQVAILDGILVPSVAHTACLQLSRTGSISGHPDWPAILARHDSLGAPLPHLAISGPSFPAELAPWSARTGAGGQLAALVDGSIHDWSDLPVAGPDPAVAALQEALVADRRAGRLAGVTAPRHRALLEAHAAAAARVQALQQAEDRVSWASAGSFTDDCLLAVEVLAAGLSRCVSLAHPMLWDSHAENDIYQNILWTDAFMGLEVLMQVLRDTPGPQGGSLADETVVVVQSEMGRAPRLNMNNGKDHWPHATLMMWGPGVQGGRRYGGYDAGFAGELVDLATGEVSPTGDVLGCGSLGATLLALGDVDPAAYVADAPLSALYG